MTTEKMFPMQGAPQIPWWLAERIYHLYQLSFGLDQTLERIAERGGFYWDEIPSMIKICSHTSKIDRLKELRKVWRDAPPS